MRICHNIEILMMIMKRIIYVLMIFYLTSTLLAYSVIASYGQQQTKSALSKNTLFAPYVLLQYGPAVDQSIPLIFRSANFLNSQNNQTLAFYAPTTTMNNYTIARYLYSLYQNDTVQPNFDSYFSYNRLAPQIVPRASIDSLSIARILDLQAQYITQTKLSHPMSLPPSDKGNVTKSFLLPTSLKRGFYLFQLSVYFPEYKIHALYSNSAYVRDMTRETASLLPSLSGLLGNQTSPSFNSSSPYRP